MKIRFLTAILLLLITLQLFPVNIRGEINGLVSISTENISTQFSLHELTAILLEETPFIERIDLTLTIPEELSRYRDSFMVTIYSGLDNTPDKMLKSYTGKKIFSAIIPVSRKMFISIPIVDKPDSDLIPGTIKSTLVPPSGFPVLLSVTPVMKGIPTSVLTSIFKLDIMPVLSNKGELNINVVNPSPENSYTVIMDEKQLTSERDIILQAGIHTIQIKSEYFKPVTRSFVIEKGKVSEITITLEPLLPTVFFETPAGTTIYLDGIKLDYRAERGIQIEPGEHVVRIELSDYSLSRKFTIEADKDYKVSLFLDILVQDN